jgi:hypothetical protein
MNGDENIRYRSLRKRRDALLANSLPDSDKRLLTYDATGCLLAALSGSDIGVALHDAEFFVTRVEEGRQQVAGIYQEAVAACGTG